MLEMGKKYKSVKLIYLISQFVFGLYFLKFCGLLIFDVDKNVPFFWTLKN